MTDAYSNDFRGDESDDSAVADDRSGLAAGSLGRAAGRLVRDPALVVPFALVAALLSGIDALRRRDPIPAVEWESLADSTVHVEYSLYPAPRSQTIRPLVALIDLEVPYLLWAVGLELLTLTAISVAGVVVIRRALDESPVAGVDAAVGRGPVASYLVFVVAVVLAGRLLGGVDAFQEMGPVLGLPVLIALAVIAIRLVLVPVLLVAGSPLPGAIRRSNRLARGSGWSLLGLILIFGFGTWLLASVPVVGTVLTGLVIAPLQIVTLVVAFERLSAREGGDLRAIT